MLEASGHTTGAQCARRDPGLCPPPPFPPAPSEGATSWALWEQADCTGELASTRTPTHCSARDTFRSHPPHTALLCAPNLPHHPKGRKKKNCFPDCLAEAWWAECDYLIYYTTYWLTTAKGNSLFIFLIIIMDNITNDTIRPQNIVKLQKKKHPSW